MNQLVAPSGARIMLWDDGIENDPSIMKLDSARRGDRELALRDEADVRAVYSNDRSGGFEQMVAPGASNWNEIFPDVDHALRNERTFHR